MFLAQGGAGDSPLFDWVTFVAQIVNFLVLVILLKVFLWNRVSRAMDERRQGIEDRVNEAARREKEAEEEASRHRERSRELDEQRESLLADAREEAGKERRELLERAREEVDERKARWIRAVEEERREFLDHIGTRAGERVQEVTRAALSDLADAELERQVVRHFTGRLAELDDHRWSELAATLEESGEEPVIRSAWPLPEDLREEVRQAVGERLGSGATLQFTASPEVVCGIELQAAGHAVSWSIASWLEDLSQALDAELERAPGIRPQAAGDGRGEEGEDGTREEGGEEGGHETSRVERDAERDAADGAEAAGRGGGGKQ